MNLRDSAQVSELHGISATAHPARPDKRERELDDGTKTPWKREATKIQMPRQVGPSNPYDPRSRPRMTGNPTAAATIVGLRNSFQSGDPRPPSKKQKLNNGSDERNGFSSRSRYFPDYTPMSMSPRNGSGSALGMFKAVPSSMGMGMGMGKGKGKELMHNEPLANGKFKGANLNVNEKNAPIVISDDLENEDIGTPIQRKSSRDELDIMISANSSMSVADDLGVPVPNNNHPFKQSSPPRPSSSRTCAKDGPSAQRLRERVGNTETRSRSPWTAATRSKSPPVITNIDEIEEFSDHNAVSTVGGARSKPPSTRPTSPVPNRATTPRGNTIFAMNNVQAKTQMYESKSKPNVRELDLKKLPPARGRTSAMRGKSGKTLQIQQRDTFERPRLSGRGTRKDQVATSSTSYRGASDALVLPLIECIWGSTILEKDSDALHPTHWFVWNTDLSELQVARHPIETGVQQKIVKSVKLEKLNKCEFQISQLSDKPFIKLRFRNSVPGIRDDEQAVGLAFQFDSNHPNTVTGITKLKTVLEKLSEPPQSLNGPAVDGAIEMSRAEAKQYGRGPTLSNDIEAVKKNIASGQYNRTTVAKGDSSTKPRYNGGTSIVALPLDVCIWGSEISEKDWETPDPSCWLLWDRELNELQLSKQPVSKQSPKPKAVKSISVDKLHGCTFEISQESAKPFIRLRLIESVPGIDDDVQFIGLAFKFHGTLATTKTNIAMLKSELERNSKPLESLVGSAVDKALEEARGMVERYRSNVLGVLSSSESEAMERGIADGQYTRPTKVEGKASIKPRPAYGRQAMKHMEPKRRSARLAPEPSSPASSSMNLDEVVLVYPHSGPGALNITNGDLKRLEPSEFLNDTLIELGLKFLMNDIREKNPELADEIHVFSTFFYKKLNHKNFEEGYKSVRKWTARVDLFKKKYIIVPINENIHWYLAIIYRPEYILDPAQPKAPPRTLRRTIKLNVQQSQESTAKEDNANDYKSETVNAVNRPLSPATMDDSDASVERVIQSTRSCSISDAHEPQHSRTDSPELGNGDFMGCDTHNEVFGNVEGGGPAQTRDSASMVSDSEEGQTDAEVDQLAEDYDFRYPPPSSHGESRTPVPHPSTIATDHPADGEGEPMEVDSPSSPSIDRMLLKHTGVHPKQFELPNRPSLEMEDDFVRLVPSSDDKSRSVSVATEERVVGNGNAVPTVSFYQTSANDPARKAVPRNSKSKSPDLDPIEAIFARHIAAEDSEDEQDDDANNMSTETDVPDERVTWVFTFDSLGTRHERACKLLSRYLCAEAQDKMHVETPSAAKGKEALVPTQPNFCDCGLYLLHFARTFLTDPDKFKHLICTTPKKQKASARGEVWQDKQVANMRKEMADRIRKESEVYRKIKAEKENQRKEAAGDSVGQAPPADSSDDEIIVGPITKRIPSPVKRGKKANGIAAPSANTRSTTSQAPKEFRASRLRG